MSTKKDDLQEQSGYEKGYQDAMKLCKLLYPDQNLDIETVKKKHQDSHEDFMEKISKLSQAAQLLIYIQVMTIEEGNATNTDLTPYLYDVLVENPEWKNYTLENLEEPRTDKDGKQIDSVLDFLLKQIKQRAKADKNTTTGLDKTELSTSFQLGTPQYYISPNTKLSNSLQNNQLFTSDKDDPIGIPVMNIGKPNETIITVSATLENLKNFPIIGKPFTEFDRAVHDAVASMYEDRIKNGAEPIFTADMIYRTMTHKTASERVSPQQRASVTKSINKMRKNIYITADCTEEFRKKGIVANPEGQTDAERYYYVLDDWLLSARHIKNMAVGGKIVDGYRFSEPLLLNYAKLTKQLITVDGKVLRIQELNDKGKPTENAISDTDNRIAVKSYLIRRTEIMRYDEKNAIDALRKYNNKRAKNKDLPEKKLSEFRKQTRIITFEDMFTDTGIESSNRKTETRQYVYQVLDYWKAINNIKSYKLRKKGKSVDAILIDI